MFAAKPTLPTSRHCLVPTQHKLLPLLSQSIDYHSKISGRYPWSLTGRTIHFRQISKSVHQPLWYIFRRDRLLTKQNELEIVSWKTSWAKLATTDEACNMSTQKPFLHNLVKNNNFRTFPSSSWSFEGDCNFHSDTTSRTSQNNTNVTRIFSLSLAILNNWEHTTQKPTGHRKNSIILVSSLFSASTPISPKSFHYFLYNPARKILMHQLTGVCNSRVWQTTVFSDVHTTLNSSKVVGWEVIQKNETATGKIPAINLKLAPTDIIKTVNSKQNPTLYAITTMQCAMLLFMPKPIIISVAKNRYTCTKLTCCTNSKCR